MNARIRRLDTALARSGEAITLERRVGTTTVSVEVRAAVRTYGIEELAGGVMQGDLRVVLSPTDLRAWAVPPNPNSAPFNADSRIPLIGDKAVVQGRRRNVQNVMPVYVAGALVRIEMTVRG